MSEHSKLPLKVKTHSRTILDASGFEYAFVYYQGGDAAEARAAFLVTAANTHDALRDALKLCADTLEGHLDEPQAVSHGECRLAAKSARAALALATPEAATEQHITDTGE